MQSPFRSSADPAGRPLQRTLSATHRYWLIRIVDVGPCPFGGLEALPGWRTQRIVHCGDAGPRVSLAVSEAEKMALYLLKVEFGNAALCWPLRAYEGKPIMASIFCSCSGQPATSLLKNSLITFPPFQPCGSSSRSRIRCGPMQKARPGEESVRMAPSYNAIIRPCSETYPLPRNFPPSE